MTTTATYVPSPVPAHNRRVSIRYATSEDIPAIQDVTREAFNKYAADLALPGKVTALNETPEDIAQDLTNKKVLVGMLDDEIAGSIRFQVIGNIAYISRFGVRLSYQKHGLGGALVRAVETECRNLGSIDIITLHTSARMSPLVRFYYGEGYFIHSTATDRGYIRALFVNELTGKPYDLTPIMAK